MSVSQDDLLWRDPAHAMSGLLHVISASLGGDLVVWATVDNEGGDGTVLDAMDRRATSTARR